MLCIFNENIVYDDAQCSLTNCKSYDSSSSSNGLKVAVFVYQISGVSFNP